MTRQEIDDMFARLRAPFPSADVEWRIGQAGKNRSDKIWAKVLAYLTARSIQERLDSVVGPNNWRNEYEAGPQGGVKCGLSLRINGEWITKYDGAENTDIESVKGGMSDAMKRAAVVWGIGRYLYELGEQWAIIDDKGSRYTHCKVKVKGADEWLDFNWEPPKLPEFALPESERSRRTPNGNTANGHSTQATAIDGTPGNGKPKHSENYSKAATSISEAKTLGRLYEISRNVRIAREAGRLSESEANGLLLVIDTSSGQMAGRPGINPMYVKAVEAYARYETVGELLTLKAKLRDPAKNLANDEISEIELLIDRKCLSMPQAQQPTSEPAGAAA